MEELDFNGQKNKFSLGDVVVFKNFPHTDFTKNTYILEDAPVNIPPFMVVIEVKLNNEAKFKVDDGNNKIIAERFSYECTWYNPNTGGFEKRKFYESLLLLVDKKQDDNTIEYDFSKKVIFRPAIHEKKKRYSSDNLYLRQRDILNYISPDFVITNIEPKNPILMDKNGIQIYIKSKTYITITWFDGIKNKFSNEDLPIEIFKDFE